ncbi:hypothetical protein [Saccharomonospora piscinae]|uniref:hypothetical protein n=1 Tax=Saccharomonospora piscinae TaxID=687388 RepID=UPI0012DFD71C|nr:hypothetical protein [Saccharomonospora piscinae]
MQAKVDKVKRLILASGVHDWVDIVVPTLEACHALGGVEERAALPLALEAVKQLLREGLIEVGEVGVDGLSPWAVSLKTIEERIDLEARNVEFPLRSSYMFWIANTTRGDLVGRSILEKYPEILDVE